MGFLNHSTNNIIIDAVLTEYGREILSKNNGKFKIKNFSFGDDEVDYTLVTKYGEDIGKEKIEKNTPIFEANPNENLAIKHPLITFSNPIDKLTLLPLLVEGKGVSSVTFYTKDSSNNNTHKDLEIKNFINTTDSSTTIDEMLNDKRFIVKLHKDLLTIDGLEFDDFDQNGIASYFVPTISSTNFSFTNQREANFKITPINVVNDRTFEFFSVAGSTTRIKTQVQIIGAQSGASIIIPVTINNTTSP